MEERGEPIRILVVDDHPIVRQGLRSLLANYPDMLIVGEAEQLRQAVETALWRQPDVVLLDIRLSGTTGIEVARALRREVPSARVIMLTSYDNDEYLVDAIQAGAVGYLLKSVSDDRLVSAIRAAYRGDRLISPSLLNHVLQQFAEMRHSQARQESGLSDEDVRVLALIASGAGNEEIGVALNWSMASVKRKLQHIFGLLGVSSRAQAAAEAVRRGLA
ncbi:MAG: response regulator [Chloroflexota bacterium]